LAVNAEEAERIREMFRLYLEGTPVIEIVQRFDKLGWRNVSFRQACVTPVSPPC